MTWWNWLILAAALALLAGVVRFVGWERRRQLQHDAELWQRLREGRR